MALMRIFPFPLRDDRNALRVLFEERCESFQADHPQKYKTVVLTSDQVHATWLAHVRPTSGTQENISFTMFWTWLCLTRERPVPVYMGLTVIAFFAAANDYYWLKMAILSFL